MKHRVVPFLVGIGVMVLVGCGRTPRDRERLVFEPTEEGAALTSESELAISKPTINVYVENSASMDGYVTGNTDFKIAVYSYLSDIKILDVTDSLNLYYINSEVIPYEDDISDFIEKLNPTSFRIRGGNRGTTDISDLMGTILENTQRSTLSILISDFIFSPGKGKDADGYLINQQIGIKRTVAEALEKYDDLGITMYQLSSQFDGIYYNREDSKTKIQDRRPFYIWIMGNKKHIGTLHAKVPTSKFKGSGVEHVFSLTQGNQEVDYAIRPGSGKFKLDKKEPKTKLIKAKKDHNGKLSFSVDADFSTLLLDDGYLKHAGNYVLNDENYQFRVTDTPTDGKYLLNLSTEKVKPSQLSIRLRMVVPEWIEQMNDDEGLDIHADGAMNKTYGIQYLVDGVYEAFTRHGDFYSEIKISVNN